MLQVLRGVMSTPDVVIVEFSAHATDDCIKFMTGIAFVLVFVLFGPFAVLFPIGKSPHLCAETK